MSELGKTNMHSHVIHTGNARPVSKAPYRQSPHMHAETGRLTNEMLLNGIIEESNSPWHSLVVLVKKPNGEYRFAIDYRELDKVTEPMSFPIPNLNDVFDTLADSEAEIFSICDLRSGFHQVPLCQLYNSPRSLYSNTFKFWTNEFSCMLPKSHV